MHAAATFKLPSGALVTLGPGDIVGRIPCAKLSLDDPRISEAHAYVSLRGASLELLALRGRLSVGGKPRTRTELAVGLRILLAGFFALEVVALELPERSLAIVRDDDGALDDATPAHGTVSVFDRDADAVLHGFHAEADAFLWTGPSGVVLRTVSPPRDRPLAPGDTFRVGRGRYRLASLPTADFESVPTTDHGVYDTALHLRLYYDVVQISADGTRMAVLTGLAANVLCELAEIGQPVAWTELARQTWPEADEAVARSRWDQLMARIRVKRREAGLRSDLIRPTGGGLVQLVLGPRDTLAWDRDGSG